VVVLVGEESSYFGSNPEISAVRFPIYPRLIYSATSCPAVRSCCQLQLDVTNGIVEQTNEGARIERHCLTRNLKVIN
jgi:hypothetical protein